MSLMRASFRSGRARWLVAFAILLVAVGGGVFADWWTVLPETAARGTYVGRQTCMQCHQQQHAEWTGSYHDLAMDRATPESVLGDFSGVTFEHHDVVSRMFRDGQRYMIHTEGPDGKLADFEVKYVFGVSPLQNYMVEFDRTPDMKPNEIARLQVLRISWDTLRKRWFYLPPPDVQEKLAPDDALHWTGIGQRWNYMCADCHSTNLQKNFDPQTCRYRTTFSEIDVSCETCHGPGSTHVTLASSLSLFWDRKLGYGLPNLKSADNDVQIQSCAPCHARRQVIYPDYRPGESFYNCFANDPLRETTYYCDGQILDEDYEHGSFLQSRMYHQTIKCTDCHNPHTTRVKHQGNRLCTSCHAHPEARYDVPAHHHHQAGSAGASCVECHMPTATYMEVDPRRDHSLRVPRPDLSVALGTPNACVHCHLEGAARQATGLGESKVPHEKRAELAQYNDWIRAARAGDQQVAAELDQLNRWSLEATERWYGKRRWPEHFAPAFHAAFNDLPDAAPRLIEVLGDRHRPNYVRMSAAFQLASRPSPEALVAVRQALADADPQVRAMAASNYEAYLPNFAGASAYSVADAAGHIQPLVQDLLPLVSDPIRLVRIEAARLLWRIPPKVMVLVTDGAQRAQLKAAFDEFKVGVLVNNDRAGAHLSLGVIYESRGEVQQAEVCYRTAIRVEPGATGPRANLAALLEHRAASEGAGATADQRKAWRAEATSLQAEELTLLARDARLVPNNAAIWHQYGLALYLAGRHQEAGEALRKACELEPNSVELLYVLAIFYKDEGQREEARKTAQRLIELAPADPRMKVLLQELE